MSAGVRTQSSITGKTGGVPFVAVPPATGDTDAPVVVSWHGFGPPRTEAALSAALPMSGLDAWRIYLGLPMLDGRLPPGGYDEVQRLADADLLLQLYGPVVTQAAAELPRVLSGLRDQLGVQARSIGLCGVAAGGAVALLCVIGHDLPVRAVGVVGAIIRPASLIAEVERRSGLPYPWSGPSRELGTWLDFTLRAGDLAAHRLRPPVLLVSGAHEDPAQTSDSRELYDALLAHYQEPGRAAHRVIPELGHALCAEPGLEPEVQLPSTVLADKVLVDWFGRHLCH